MKNRFCRKGMTLLYAACLLSAVGLMNACTDDYDLDETMPGDLKGSIYDELKAATENGKPVFSYTVRLIDDLEYAEVLSKTGSKTLFVAPDSAYVTFFNKKKKGTWENVHAYEDLSLAQKKYLLYNCMLNNAYVMEMMAHVQSSGTLGQDNYQGGANLCLRQASAATVTDSIPYLKWYELPKNYNSNPDLESEDALTRNVWEWHNKQSNKDGIYLVCDNTMPMMTHFLEGNMKYRDITNDDVAEILGIQKYGTENRSYIYNARVIKQDVTCMNGYYNVLDRVLETPGNMAEIIRTNGKTNLFSRILDRFSVPLYNQTLTDNAQTLYADVTDSVFVKRYFSVRGQSADFAADHLGNPLNAPKLSFDPAWNHYKSPSSSITAEQDMAAMFVPTDSALIAYFTTGAGSSLIKTFGQEGQSIEYNLDQIPVNIIKSLVNNLMKASFYESVPHKYLTIMNDARDQMFNLEDFPSVEAYLSKIDHCELANNGVVYILKYVPAPADFSAVIAPAINSTNTQVVRSVLQADEDYIQGSSYNNAPFKQYFSTYLKAMQSSFSFFVPTDEGLKNYGFVDPASVAFGNENLLATGKDNSMYYWSWEYKPAKGGGFPVAANAYRYRPATGQSGVLNSNDKISNKSSNGGGNLSETEGAVKKNLLIDMINQHIVVHDNVDQDGVIGKSQQYFLSREGAPVFVKSGNQPNGTQSGLGMEVMGGWQAQLASDTLPENDHVCTVVTAYDQTKATNGYGNGHTYLLDRPMQPAIQSVYYALKTHEQFSKFIELCTEADNCDDVLDSIGFREILDEEALAANKEKLTKAEWEAARKLYKVFVAGKTHTNDYLVRFFNNYRYTGYIPNNNAIDAAIANGLPTWTDIKKTFEDSREIVEVLKEDGTPETDKNGNPKTKVVISDANKAKLQAMVTMLVNFLKYHFQDESLFVDNVTKKGEYQTQSIDEKSNVYITLNVQQTNGNIAVTDKNKKTINVKKDNNFYNVMVRDAAYSSAIKDNTNGIYVSVSSYAVLHEVDEVLNFFDLNKGRYDDAWKTSSAAKKFVKKYQIKK